jgi:hypothetical protein
MDPVSAVSLVGVCMSIIRYAVSASTGLSTLRQRLREAEQDVETLRAEVDAIKLSTERFRSWLQGNQSDLEVEQAQVLRRTLTAIETTLRALETRVNELVKEKNANAGAQESTTAKIRRFTLRKRLAYAFNVDEIERYRSRLSNQLGVLNFEYKMFTQ